MAVVALVAAAMISPPRVKPPALLIPSRWVLAMAWGRHVPVLVTALLLLVVARQIWPYADVHDPVVEEGMQVDLLIGNLGGPTCMEWLDNETMLVCDRDGGASSSFLSPTTVIGGPVNPRPGLMALTSLTMWPCSMTHWSCLRQAAAELSPQRRCTDG